MFASLQILRHRVWDYSPDMMILAFLTGNDVRNNSRALQRDDRMPYFVHKGRANARILRCAADFGEAGLDEIVYREPSDDTWREAWKVTEDLLSLMNKETRQRRATFMVVTLSNGDQVQVRRANARHRANR